MDVRRFEADLSRLEGKICAGEEEVVCNGIERVKKNLVSLYKRNLVKINHSSLELLCAKNLFKEGYDVEVEHRLTKDLICDVFGTKGDGSFIVEIETGFVPPAHALDPATYCNARVASKIARYSPYAGKFAIGTTPSNLVSIPAIFQEPPRFRNPGDAEMVKTLCDIYYNKPSITIEQIIYGLVHIVYILDIDNARVEEISPDAYMQSILSLPFRRKELL